MTEPHEVTVTFKSVRYRSFPGSGKHTGQLVEVAHPIFAPEGSKIFVDEKMIHARNLADRLIELQDAVEVALSHLDDVDADTGDASIDNKRRAECAAHAREVLKNVL